MGKFIARIAAIGAIAGLLVVAAGGRARAYEAADSDAFFLGIGSSNIEVRNSQDLLSGEHVDGGLRLGLFWTFFLELGYGTVTYTDTARVAGVDQAIDFRTTGGFLGAGLVLPIRKVRLGLTYRRNPNNKWVEEITDATTGTVLVPRVAGKINFDTYNVFALFGETGLFEVGARRDRILSTDSAVTNAFGPYIAFNISLK